MVLTRPGLDFGTFSTSFESTGDGTSGLVGWRNVYTFHPPPAPAAEPPPVPTAVGEAAAAAGNGAISSTPIPISWGQRRIVGKVIDHILHPLNADGIGAEILDVCAGMPLFKDVPNALVKIVADGTTIYDVAQGGVIHPGLTSVVWYDGCDDDQIADPTFVAVYGADVTPGYVGLMHAVLDFNSYAAWNGTRPGITLFITDTPADFQTFQPWGTSPSGDIETLNPEDCSVDIGLTNGNTTAARVGPIPYVGPNWAAVRGTKGRAANQPMGRGWFVFEAVNDHLTEYPENPFGIFPTEHQGPGLATETFNIEGGDAGNEQSLYVKSLTGIGYNNTTTGADTMTMPEGDWAMFVVRLDVMKFWKGYDSYYGWNPPNPPIYPAVGGSPIDNIGGLDISYLAGQGLIYPAWFGRFVGAKGSLNLTGPFLNTPPGWGGEIVDTGMRNWGEVFVALALHANLDPDQIVPLDITEESEGGVIYDGFSWTDVVSNAGKISNIDWWEDGENIYVKQTALDAPPTDVDGIPLAHRYVLDEDHGSSEAERGGERRKPSVFELSYYDVSRQFQQSMVPARSEAHKSVTVQKLSVPFVMTAEAAATRSAIALGKSEMEMEEHKLSLPPTVPYFRLRPVDIVEFDEQARGIRTKVRSWTLDSDWGVEVTLQKLFTTATDPTVPLDLEAIVASLPRFVPWRLEFDDRNNSGYVAAISGQ